MLFAAMLVAGVPSIGAEPASRPTVTVRTYNYAQIPDDSLGDARTSVDAIFEPAGISVRWLDCRVPQNAAGASCIEPLEHGTDLVLRLLDRGGETTKHARTVALGESMLDREQRTGVLMTLELPFVRAIASQADADMPLLLGRAIAHEIGHLLLGTGDHPREGLMRARWSQEELRGFSPSNWLFSPGQAAQMRRSLTPVPNP